MRRQSWQVMEAKLYCAHVSLYDAIFFLTSYVNVCQSVQSQGLQMSPPPTCLTLCVLWESLLRAVELASLGPLAGSA